MDKELAWFLVPVCSVLWMLGGGGYPPFGRYWRRIGVPLCVFITFLLFGRPWGLSLLSSTLLAIATTLPFTAVGDRLSDSWFNWIWIWLAGYILGICSFPVSQSLLFPLVPLMVQGVLGSLSNTSCTARFLPWKWVEACVGASVAYCWALPLSS